MNNADSKKKTALDALLKINEANWAAISEKSLRTFDRICDVDIENYVKHAPRKRSYYAVRRWIFNHMVKFKTPVELKAGMKLDKFAVKKDCRVIGMLAGELILDRRAVEGHTAMRIINDGLWNFLPDIRHYNYSTPFLKKLLTGIKR